MKRLLLIFSLAVTIFSIGCNSGSEKKTPVSRPERDTVRTLAVYVDYPKKGILYGQVWRISRDTVVFSDIDTSDNGEVISAKRKVVRDTMYLVPRTQKDGQYVKDSAGVVLFYPTFFQAVSQHDNMDSGVKKLEDWIKNNPNVFPKDTAALK